MSIKTSIFIRLLTLAVLAALVATPPVAVAQEGVPANVQEMMRKLQSLSPEELAEVREHMEARRRVPLKATSGFTCLPSCDVADAKFLAVAGSALDTLSESTFDLTISAPAVTTSFTFGIFDGDGGVVDPLNVPPPGLGSPATAWDRPSSPPVPEDYTYTLYSSPLGATGPETVVMGPITSSTLLNNAWDDFTVDTTVSPGADALAPSGNYIFRLEIARISMAAPNAINVFKVRTSGVVTIRLGEQPFSYISNFNNTDDFFTVFPDIFSGSTANTTYNGDWSFFFDVAEGQEDLLVWDGDFDHGRFDADATQCLPLAPAAQRACLLAADQDTNDADTLDAPFLPLFVPLVPPPDAVPEGVAVGFGTTTGDPPDDVDIPTGLAADFDFFVRQPSVRYDVAFPDGRMFSNDNPSGNLEWEQFRISTQTGCDPDPLCVPTGTPVDPNDPVGGACADVCLAAVPGQIPAGVYQALIDGVDAFNLNALRLPQILCVDLNGAPCDPLRRFQLGDTVFLDEDGDGVQTGSESGIQGVILNLLGSTGGLAGQTITDGSATGNYSFDVDRGTFTVQVAPENFALAPVGAVGDRVYFDADGGGTDNSGSDPGLANVSLVLYEDGVDNTVGTIDDEFRAATITDANGFYRFSNLPDGTYYVDVIDASVPAGLTITQGPDPSLTAAIAGNEDLTLDFGYTPSANTLGDFVWLDADGLGDQTAGEVGIGGVTLELYDSGSMLVATTTTGADGFYLFAGLAPATYTVVVDVTTLPAGLTPTFDLDGGLDSMAARVLGPPTLATDVDFGYTAAATYTLSDSVWIDVARNAVRDPGDTGIAGVTVSLLDASDKVIANAVSDANGEFSFSGLIDGSYGLAITDVAGVLDAYGPGLVNLVPTTQPAVEAHFETVIAGADVANDSFGYNEAGALEDLVGTTLKDPVPDVDEQLDVVPIGDPEDNNPNYDFGYIAAGSLGDRVWHDNDGAGDQDPVGEPGIEGVDVELFDPDTGITTTTTTGTDGVYTFPNLRPNDDYQVTVVASTLPPGVTEQTYDLDDMTGPPITTPNTALAPLGLASPGIAEERDDVDFGYRDPNAAVGSIGDRVWNDRDGDGVQDAGEVGINDVVVRLFDSGGSEVGTGVTSGDGEYLFENLDPGTYKVVVDSTTLPEGFVQTFDVEGPLDHEAGGIEAVENRRDVDFGYADECLEEIDFETDGLGTSLDKGQRIDDELAAFGVTVSTGASAHPAMIFDSSMPSGGDWDLGTPNVTFNGPGIGSGGEMGQPGANGVPLGKVLIISEDDDSDDPDDDAAGGTITFDFAYPVRVDEVGILDIDEGLAGTVTARDGLGMVIGSIGMANDLGNNSVQTVELGVSGVRSLEIHFPGSGAVSGIVFCADCSPKRVRDDFEVSSFSNNDGPDDWSGDWIENDPEAGGAGPSSGQVQVHSGLLTLDDYPNTGGEPSAAREVDLSGAVSAGLSFTFATSSGVDYDDAVTVEISADGGATWSSLEVLTGIYGAVQEDRDYDISAFISSETKVRFRVSNKYGGSNELFCVFYLEIETDCGDCQGVSVRDNFEVPSFSNNNGPDDWAGNWIEDDPTGPGPSAGQVRIKSGFLKLDDSPDTGGDPSLAREVDLSGATTATLEFDFDTSAGVDKDDAVTVEVSADGGASWTTLEVITDIDGSTWDERSFDITSFISAQTQVRFRVSNKYGASDEHFFVNYVQISSNCASTLTVRDEFNTRSFGNNDGPDDWESNWIEDDPGKNGAGPTAGHVKVYNDALKLFDNPDTGGEPSAAREVDLSGRTTATFSYSWWTSAGVDATDAIAVEVSSDGGATWTLLQNINGFKGAGAGSESWDISGHISADTQVRFRVSNYYGGSDEYFYADNVQIQAD